MGHKDTLGYHFNYTINDIKNIDIKELKSMEMLVIKYLRALNNEINSREGYKVEKIDEIFKKSGK